MHRMTKDLPSADDVRGILKVDPEATHYCPDCGCQYVTDVGNCGDLTGCSRPKVLPINPFPDPYDGKGELIFDHALDVAAERIANVHECTCERCRDAEVEVRRELIEEGRRRADLTFTPLATEAGQPEGYYCATHRPHGDEMGPCAECDAEGEGQ